MKNYIYVIFSMLQLICLMSVFCGIISIPVAIYQTGFSSLFEKNFGIWMIVLFIVPGTTALIIEYLKNTLLKNYKPKDF